VRHSPTIADALTLGSGKLAVDAVLLIAEHGDYPLNAKLQKRYPRGRCFRGVLDVVRASGRAVPVFIDKHLSYSLAEAQQMVDQARALNVPLMAGSSLPVTWRLPPLEIPLGRTITDVLVASRGNLEIFGFHALETLQCMAERRDRKGKPQGVKSVTYLEGDAVWRAADQGVWSWELLRHALGRNHTVNPGDIKQNTRDFAAPATRDAATILNRPVAFVVDYADGLRATALILNGHIDDTTVAVRLNDPSSPGPGRVRDTIVSTLMYLPAPPRAPASSTPWCCGSRISSRPARPPTLSSEPSSPAASSTPPSTAACNTTSPSPPPSCPPSTTPPRPTQASSARHYRANAEPFGA